MTTSPFECTLYFVCWYPCTAGTHPCLQTPYCSISCPTLLAWINFEVIACLVKCGVKLLIHSPTSMVQPLKFGNGWIISTHIFWTCHYLSMLGLKWNHVSWMGPCYVSYLLEYWSRMGEHNEITPQCQFTIRIKQHIISYLSWYWKH